MPIDLTPTERRAKLAAQILDAATRPGQAPAPAVVPNELVELRTRFYNVMIAMADMAQDKTEQQHSRIEAARIYLAMWEKRHG